MNVQIVRSSQLSLSSMSHLSAVAILEVLEKNYINAGITIVDNLSDLLNLVARKPDLVFLGMQYVFDDNKKNKVWLSKFMDDNQIAYTGSPMTAHALESSKHKAKKAVIDAGLKTSPFTVIRRDKADNPSVENINYPMFVKPTSQGGGAGIDSNSVVWNFDELQSKIISLANINRADALVEQYLTGREFSVAVIRDEETDELTAMPIELIAEPDENGVSILSRKVKASNNEIVLRVNNPEVYDAVTTLAVDVFKTLGARDYGRIDIRMDENGVPHFLEANLIPSLIKNYGSFPKACILNHGLEYEPMIMRIASMALGRA